MQNRDLYFWYQNLEDKSLANVCTVFRQHFFSNFQIAKNDLTLFSKIKGVIQKVRLLTKKKKEEFLLLNFISSLCETNVLPFLQSTSSEKEKNFVKDLHLKIKNQTLKRKVEEIDSFKEVSENYCNQLNGLESEKKKLKLAVKTRNGEKLEFVRQAMQCKALYTATNKSLLSLEKILKLKNKTNKIRNLNKKIVYRDIKLKKQEKEIDALKAQFEKQSQTLNMEFNNLNQMLENSNAKVEMLCQEKRNLKKKLSRVKNNLSKTKETISFLSIENLTFLKSEVKELSEKVESLNKENIYLNGLLELLEDEKIVTFERGRYSNDIREVIMDLKMKLSDLCKDASPMLNATPVFNPRDVKIHKDKLY